MRSENGRNGTPIRYSEAFKIEVVRELERTQCTFTRLMQKYRIRGSSTINKWAVKYGDGSWGKVIRVEKPDEISELSRLRKEMRLVKESLADAHVALSVEKAYLEVACERMGQTVEDFKKKKDGRRRAKP